MQKQTYLPAEWHEQDGILLTWPHEQSAWQTSLAAVNQTYIELTAALSHHQGVYIQLHTSLDIEAVCQQIAAANGNLSHCHFIEMNSNDTWARDHGPITIFRDEKPVCLNFNFNGWGNKFPAELDNKLNHLMQSNGAFNQLEDIDWVLEGGSIESDGDGTLLTTSACVANQNRNGQASEEDLTQKFQQWFGCSQVLFLSHGELAGDDTDAHIDTLARFAPNNVIIFQGCDDVADEHFQPLQDMKQELLQLKNRHGQAYQLVELPLPAKVLADDGHRLPATYANFLITNKLVIVPTYDDAHDAAALKLIGQVFPDHQTIGINALPLIEEHGSIHCISMQLPKGSITDTAAFEKSPSTGY